MLSTFQRFAHKKQHLVVGLMSGTSIDGVDAAVCVISGEGRGKMKVGVRGTHSAEISSALRKRILALCRPGGGSSAEICELNFVLGEEFAHAAKNAIHNAKLKLKDVDLIGSHGQTIAHRPPGADCDGAGLQKGSTLQIGEAAVIAERTGIAVISNFRTRDMAAGGHGAPLVPYADWLLFSSKTISRVALNIGGIANVTCMPAGGDASGVIAFDTGPGNMILDALAERVSGGELSHDVDGALAAAGKVNGWLLDNLLEHPYFERKPPKSTGREEFGTAFAHALFEKGSARGLSANSILATATMFTAQTIAESLRGQGGHRSKPSELIVAGGGTRNPTLMKMLCEQVHGWRLRSTEEFGIPAQFRECAAFAILARETMLGRPSSLPGATGARGPRVLGDITPGA